MTKTCKTCGQTKPIEAFKKRRLLCKKCHAVQQREYYHKNKKKEKAKRDARREELNQRSRDYYERNAERIRASKRQYRQENPEKIKAYRQRRVEELSDTYVAKVLRKGTELTKEDVMNYPDLIAAYRQYLTTKRKIKIVEHERNQSREGFTAENDCTV